MRCGYMYETQHCNFFRSKSFYRKADKLRYQNKIHHRCPFKDDEMLKISKYDTLSLSKFKQKTKVNKRVWSWEYKPLDLCVKCINAYAKLHEEFDESMYFQDRLNSLSSIKNDICSCGSIIDNKLLRNTIRFEKN
ncbi:hypothetical protein RF11_00649 [Thelohanellus kitauei]|uniref:Uncharacterized protein n=1 Tax=Thelohanellus kitauei TaxID=669202 RepID=A0A0C2NGG8_THEKT|nr:hypothetical protein RF11_00649 [Thelohanellus kitauei]